MWFEIERSCIKVTVQVFYEDTYENIKKLLKRGLF